MWNNTEITIKQWKAIYSKRQKVGENTREDWRHRQFYKMEADGGGANLLSRENVNF
jgi:hypothetical protein